jgi:hypothetical protein
MVIVQPVPVAVGNIVVFLQHVLFQRQCFGTIFRMGVSMSMGMIVIMVVMVMHRLVLQRILTTAIFTH